MAPVVARCQDCHKDEPIRARNRCSGCYGRFYMSPAFSLVSNQSTEFHRLTDVNVASREAVCSRCGPVKVTRCADYRGRESFRCNTTRRRQKRHQRQQAQTFRRMAA